MAHQNVSITTAYVAQSLAAGTPRRRMETETTTLAFYSRLRRSFKKKNTRNAGYNVKNQYQLTHGPQQHTRNGSLQKVHTGLKAKQKSLKRGFYDSMRS